MPPRRRVTDEYEDYRSPTPSDDDGDSFNGGNVSEGSQDTSFARSSDSGASRRTERGPLAAVPLAPGHATGQGGGTIAMLSQMLENEQIKNTALENKCRDLQIQLEKTKNELRALKSRKATSTSSKNPSQASGPVEARANSSSSPVNGPTTGDIKVDEEIKRLGKKFCLMFQVFIEDAWFMRPCSDVENFATDPRRYESAEGFADCCVRELYFSTPEAYHPMLAQSSIFQALFKAGATAYISSLMHTLRNQTAPTIFGMPHLTSAYRFGADRSSLDEFKKLLAWDPSSGVKSKFFLPVHFPDGKYNLNVVFKRKELALLIRSCIFGPASISEAALNNRNWVPGHSNGKTWGLKGTNPNLISWAAVASVSVHNSDQALTEVGETSGFRYKDAQRFYERFLYSALNNGGPSAARIRNLLAWYNGIIFPRSWLSAEDIPLPEDDIEDEIEAALAGINLEDEPDESDAVDDVTRGGGHGASNDQPVAGQPPSEVLPGNTESSETQSTRGAQDRRDGSASGEGEGTGNTQPAPVAQKKGRQGNRRAHVQATQDNVAGLSEVPAGRQTRSRKKT
ncbi:hypothetical protein DFP72DRAFT_1095448 [Ephemerocybe angulata]|uniref:Uncharacterized protein n=1 Tax=Ephemerocybe angulata TaxID=980116 RepID=A0A8H6HBZ2_9AGAR|nr:hypothetical protein DFP72DRAFT_1095448 [Tulosesus angulatus]